MSLRPVKGPNVGAVADVQATEYTRLHQYGMHGKPVRAKGGSPAKNHMHAIKCVATEIPIDTVITFAAVWPIERCRRQRSEICTGELNGRRAQRSEISRSRRSYAAMGYL